MQTFPRIAEHGAPRGTSASLLEGCELVEGVPEEGRLSFGLCQGKHLLLRDAGGHCDVALVEGVQALVWWCHGASAVAWFKGRDRTQTEGHSSTTKAKRKAVKTQVHG